MSTTPPKTYQSTRPIGQILATLELPKAQPTTPPPSQNYSESAKQESKRETWLAKWFCLKLTHPKLRLLQERIYDFAADYAKTPARGRTLVLYGENGCGKTKTARALARWARAIPIYLPPVESKTGLRLPVCEFENWPYVVNGFHKKQFDVTNDLIDAELLILDDLGGEHDPSGFAREQLYLILTKREFRWNLFTTNILPGEWENKFERRIASRLFRNAEHIDLSDVPDFSTL